MLVPSHVVKLGDGCTASIGCPVGAKKQPFPYDLSLKYNKYVMIPLQFDSVKMDHE